MPDRHENETHSTQTSNDQAWVGVKEGFHRDTQERVTDVVIEVKDGSHHVHLGINESGNEVFRNER